VKITAVRVETLELPLKEPFVIASSALANAIHGDAGLPWGPGGYSRDIGSGLRAELRDGVSTVLVPQAPGLGIALDEDAIAAQRVARRW